MGNTLILPGLMRVLHHDHITLRHTGGGTWHTGRHIRRDLDDGRPRLTACPAQRTAGRRRITGYGLRFSLVGDWRFDLRRVHGGGFGFAKSCLIVLPDGEYRAPGKAKPA